MVAAFGPVAPGTLRDYQQIFAASYSESEFVRSPARFWIAIRSILSAQEVFVFGLFYPLVFAESLVFVVLLNKYGTWSGKWRPYDWLVDNVLLRGVSQWHVLLTPFNFPADPERRVAVDILTQEDHLYQGKVADFFINPDGELSGILLDEPRRFDRQRFLRERRRAIHPNREGNIAADPEKIKPKDYWIDIPGPGRNLFIPAGKILNLNVRYELTLKEEPTTVEAAQSAQTSITELLQISKKVKIEPPDKKP